MKSRVKVIISLILGAFGIILILTPYQLFPVCNIPAPDGTPMKCAYSAKLIIAMGLVILAFNLLSIAMRKKAFFNIAYLMTIAAAFVTYALPKQLIKVGNKKALGWEIGYCAKAGHGCKLHTQPALEIIVPLVIVIAVIALILNFLIREDYA